MGWWSSYRSGQHAGDMLGSIIYALFMAVFATTRHTFDKAFNLFYSLNYREHRETLKLYSVVKADFDVSPYAKLDDIDYFIHNLV